MLYAVPGLLIWSTDDPHATRASSRVEIDMRAAAIPANLHWVIRLGAQLRAFRDGSPSSFFFTNDERGLMPIARAPSKQLQ